MMYSALQCTVLLILLLCGTLAKSQMVADLTKIHKTQNSAVDDQIEINRLQSVLINKFLVQANDSTTKLHQQVQDFFDDYKINHNNTEQFNYPEKLETLNLSVSITDFEYSWELLPGSGDTSLYEGNNNTSINAIVIIPVYDSFRRGYSINSISFICSLSEHIIWTEKTGNKIPVEKLAGYKKRINFEAKMIELN